MEKTPLFEKVLTANPVFYRTYSRRAKDKRETWIDVCKRTTEGLTKLGKLTQEESDLIYQQQKDLKALTSGRYLWVGGTEWSEQPDNFPGVYNCSSTAVDSWDAFALIMDVTMMGCGAGAMLEPKYINQLPIIRNKLNLIISKEIGGKAKHERTDKTSKHDSSQLSMSLNGFSCFTNETKLIVGDSRKGWVDAYRMLLELSADPYYWDRGEEIDVLVDLSNVRPMGEKLKGFGGVANPALLPDMFINCAKVLNRAVGRKLNSLECCLLIDHAALAIVAGSIRRSAGIKQSCKEDDVFTTAKDNLWQQDEHGNWRIDPERDALRMSNHTRVFHQKPTKEEVLHAVNKQYYSGEGAIQWVGEAIARSNCDLPLSKKTIIDAYEKGTLAELIKKTMPEMDEKELEHRLQRYGLNPCGEIQMFNNFCNLGEVHLNQIDPHDEQAQYDAFKAASLSVASLLHHKFVPERYQYSREVDPIVGVSFTGLFDFFVNAFGLDWLKWWEAGRPKNELSETFKEQEQAFLSKWKGWVHDVIWEYCDRHGLRRPNRCTTVQPSGCTDKTALRVFEQGLFYADEFMSPGQGDVSGFNLSVRKGISVTSGIANQLLPVVKVTLTNGRILRMTHDHRLSVDGKWVRADHLTKGMKIDFSLGEYDKSTEAVLLPLDQSHYTREYRQQIIGRKPSTLTKDILSPSIMSPDLGYFLGCLFGNGSLSPKTNRIRFSFDPKNMEIVEKLQSIANNLFGLHGVITYDKRSPESKLELCFTSLQLTDWFNLNGLDKTKSKDLDRIPLSIRRSSKETILSFICGLIDTDGCVRKEGSLSIDLASESFIRNLQQIGEAVGLSFTVFHNTQGQNLQKEKNMWGVCLSRMVSKPESLDYLNQNSYKCQKRNIPAPKRYFKFNPYSVETIEFETIPDYTYDFTVNGIDDNDSWYWQGGLKSHNSKSLLTGASPGWHPPKAQRFIRRITFRRDDPVALACIDYGYNVIPSQSDKDENGHLLNDPYDPRCTEWLVEIPVEVSWANVPGADTIDIHNFSVLAQFDFYMQVQQNYTAHNCFSRDTAFLTDKGIKTFESFIPGETVKVLNSEGDWVDATVVRTKEERTMYEITLRQGSTGKVKKIVATGCHRFPVKRASGGNSTIKTLTTLQLKPGHRLVTNYADLPDIDEAGIVHGMVWGDGSRYRHNTKGEYKGSQLYLCGAKRELVGYLEKYERIYKRDDIDQTRIYGLPVEYKSSLPDENCSQEYLAGFIAGLLATDGNIACSTISISTSDYEVTRFLERQSPRLGMSVTSINWFESNSYKEGGGAYQVVFSKNSFPENLILRSHHKEEIESRGTQPRQWKVVSVEELVEKQYGWCVMEPVTNQFTLSDNILVMNTSATLEFRENEIEPLADRIYQAIRDDEGYISAALLARFDDLQTFPRLPFEPIDKETYDKLYTEMIARRKIDDFHEALMKYDFGDMFDQGPAGCDSDKCLIGSVQK